jgi:hypothetical protein
VAPAPEAAPAAPDATPASGGPAAAAPFLDAGPCSYPGCAHAGLRVARVLCLLHAGEVVVEGLRRERGPVAADADPIEAGVRRATRPRRWWRSEDPHYVAVAQLYLADYRRRGWPVGHHPTARDIGPLLAAAEGREPDPRGAADARAVYDRCRTASLREQRRGKPPVGVTMARADALAEFEAEQGLRPGADYAQIS